MPTLPVIELPTIDLNAMKVGGVELPFKLPFDLPTIDLPAIDLNALKIGGVELPELPFDLPKVDFSKFEIPNVDLPTAEQVIDFFKDATLAGTGLVSLTAESIADLQKQLVEALRAQLDKVRKTA